MRKLFIVALLALLAFAASPCRAQFVGYVGLQTTVTKFSIAVGATSSTFPIPNLGQVGHTVQFQWNTGGSICEFTLDGSTDGVNWIILAAGYGTGFPTSFPLQYVYANGYFSAIRLKVNGIASSGCASTTLTGSYTGYQNTIPVNQVIQNTGSFPSAPGSVTFTSPAPVTPFAGGTGNIPFVVRSLQCYNPNSTAAYVQVIFAQNGSTPTLGAIGSNFGIAATSSFTYQGPALFGLGQLFLGAATTQNGTIAVATGVSCQVGIDLSGPFYPIATSDNP